MAHVKEMLLLLANMMNGEQLETMMDKNKYFIMQNASRCVCKSETTVSTASQLTLLVFLTDLQVLDFCFYPSVFLFSSIFIWLS